MFKVKHTDRFKLFVPELDAAIFSSGGKTFLGAVNGV